MKAKSMIRWMIILVILAGMISACSLPVARPSPEEVQAAANALTSQDPSQATEADIQTAFDLAAQAQEFGLDQTAQDLLDWASQALKARAQDLMQQDPCEEASLERVRQALEHAATAQALGDDSTANQLIEYAKAVFQNYAASRAAAGADAKERTELAVTAQQLGLDQLGEDLMAGKAIASLCEEEWQGTLEHSGEYSTPPMMELIAIVRFEFTFKVDRQGRVQGSGRGKYTLVKYVLYVPGGPGIVACPGTVEVPDFDVTVSGAKGDQTFDLKLEGTMESTMTVPPCYWGDGGYFSAGPIGGKTPFTFAYAIAAQEGTHSCGTGCTIEIRKR